MTVIDAHRRFLITLSALALFITVGSSFVGASTWYRQHVDGIGNVDDRFAPTRIDADVLIVGDSAAQVGVMPNIVAQRSGLSTYNRAVLAPVFDTMGDLILDTYMANNRPPRLIVLYLSDTTNPFAPIREGLFDAARLIFRYQRGNKLMWRFLRDHPSELYEYPYLVWEKAATQLAVTTAHYQQRMHIVETERGFTPVWLPVDTGKYHPLMQDGCKVAARPVSAPLDYIRYFRNRYEHAGTKVVVYLAPMPDCDANAAAVARAFDGVADNQFYQLPHGWFLDDRTHAHLSPEGAARNSVIVGDFLKSFVARLDQARTQSGGSGRDMTVTR